MIRCVEAGGESIEESIGCIQSLLVHLDIGHSGTHARLGGHQFAEGQSSCGFVDCWLSCLGLTVFSSFSPEYSNTFHYGIAVQLIKDP